MPQVMVYPAIAVIVLALLVFALYAGMPAEFFWPVEILVFAFLIWMLSFFRDPRRIIPSQTNLILAPADGTVTDIETLDNDFIGGKSVRIGIFLSIFNVHLNRMPCGCIVDEVIYNKGLFKNAMNLESGRVNESNDLYLHKTDEPKDAIIVRQISGAIARRIVCQAQAGQKFEGGQLFGMIKFGSRTEIYLPAREDLKVVVKIGDKVKAGLTVAARYVV